MSGSFSYLGFFAGMTIAILIGYAIVIQGRRVNLKAFFRISTFMLVIFASGMIAYGTHEIEEFAVKGNHLEKFGIKEKEQIPRVWDILKPKQETDESFFYSYNINGKDKYTHLFHDKGRIGVFLKGFLGYNSNPNYPEVLLWLISLFFGIKMWKRFYF
jgi:high-affinity iron transporter